MERRSFRGIRSFRGNSGREELQGNKIMEESFRGIKQ